MGGANWVIREGQQIRLAINILLSTGAGERGGESLVARRDRSFVFSISFYLSNWDTFLSLYSWGLHRRKEKQMFGHKMSPKSTSWAVSTGSTWLGRWLLTTSSAGAWRKVKNVCLSAQEIKVLDAEKLRLLRAGCCNSLKKWPCSPTGWLSG